MTKLRMPKNCVLVTTEPGTVITLVGAEVFRKQQIQKSDRSKAAYHEAGHVLGCLTFAIPIIEVRIDPPHLHRGRYQPPSRDLGLEAMCTMSLCGGAAERLIFPDSDGGDEIDLQMVREYLKPRGALRMLGEIERMRTAARRLVSAPAARRRIEVIAAALLQHGVLSGDQIVDLLA